MTGTSIHNTIAVRNVFENIPNDSLKRRTVRGGAVTAAAQAACFILQMGSTMVRPVAAAVRPAATPAVAVDHLTLRLQRRRARRRLAGSSTRSRMLGGTNRPDLSGMGSGIGRRRLAALDCARHGPRRRRFSSRRGGHRRVERRRLGRRRDAGGPPARQPWGRSAASPS